MVWLALTIVIHNDLNNQHSKKVMNRRNNQVQYDDKSILHHFK